MPLRDGGNPEPAGVTGGAGCIAGGIPGAAGITGGAGWGGRGCPVEGSGASGVAGGGSAARPAAEARSDVWQRRRRRGFDSLAERSERSFMVIAVLHWPSG